MRYLFALILSLWPFVSGAQDWEDRQLFQAGNTAQTLRILSSTDTSFFAPIIEQFLSDTPAWSVEYLVTTTSDIDRKFRENPDQFDIIISSAMDLQLKLVNDGFALELSGIDHPEWAQWRQRLFAFTTEPAAIVINSRAFKDKTIPQTRQELIHALRQQPDLFRGKLGTYDVRQSGVGYLFATQDARVSETYWRLMEVMGSLNARLYCCSGEMIDDVASGKLLVAYNVLGSYAAARRQKDPRFEIILPSDFPTTMMRTGFVSKATQHVDASERFIQKMIDIQSTDGSTGSSRLPPLDKSLQGTNPSVISLEPALMTYLDGLKRRTFIKEWMSAVVQ
ncbi:ABC transporter substrate-binding protein [Phaeobacter gallaeciensis]|uniref:ABC transporter substrate-binding protein n=2 Tax=Roseobacteraceae TaxID=2854170 RepID=A0A366WNV1_9RHOB|nr:MULTISPECIES: ABC transporter substrate-binding protein [Roseobacteraceae]MBT3141587.1 ABC transporter substrate-binding protein [Falsiruegeria litorea]MBT8167272.1 ABC transporter substrate-binding protein [Falsiruegeria litorea]RBW50847.1 ABC transporter substrate-binding protein [Phaeobacter gallaeciensis]